MTGMYLFNIDRNTTIAKIQPKYDIPMEIFITFTDLLMMEFLTQYHQRQWQILLEVPRETWGSPHLIHRQHLTTHRTWGAHGYLEAKCTHPYLVHPLVELVILGVEVEPTIRRQENLTHPPQHRHLPPPVPVLTQGISNRSNNSI